MASLRSILTAKPIVRPQQITRYNDLRTVTFNGTAPAGAPAAMERVSQQVLPPDFSCEWTGTAYPRYRRNVRVSVPGQPLRELGIPLAVLLSRQTRKTQRQHGAEQTDRDPNDLFAQIGMWC